MKNRVFDRATSLESIQSQVALGKLMGLLFAAVMICLCQSLPTQAAADQSGKCSIDVELETLSDIVITKVESDGYFGSIHYETKDKGQEILDLGQGGGGKALPMKILADNRSVRLSDLRGARVSSMKASRKDCKFSHPVVGDRPLSHQWTIRVELSR